MKIRLTIGKINEFLQ